MQAGIPVFFTAVLTVFLLSCGDCSRRIDCPGYKDDTLDSWFPYQNNQRLVLRNSANQFDTITLVNTETTAPYQARSGAFGPPLYCQAHKVFQSAEVDTFKRHQFMIELNTGPDARMVYGTIGGASFHLYKFTGNGLAQVSLDGRNAIIKLLATVTLGNRRFANVVEATVDTTSGQTAGLYQLYYARGEGLVGYSEYPSQKTWIKQ